LVLPIQIYPIAANMAFHGLPFSSVAVHERFAYVSAAFSMLPPRRIKPNKMNHPAKNTFMLTRLS
jgi:hypothetical protein